jgi:predicted ATPase/anti-sigma regulatory factor (Ser/Thr protein kinase)
MHDLTDYQFSTLWEDGDHVLRRGTRGDVSVLVVMTTSPRGQARLQHMYAIRDDLDAAWAVLPIAQVAHHGAQVLLCEDPGVDLLAQSLASFRSLTDKLRVAIGITVALRQLHAKKLVHKDLKPANVFASATGAAWITGFGIASRAPRERQAPEPPEIIAGTLAYMAPEQTGRMNRSIDSRTDLYALGVTLYELFAGALPFTAKEPIEWIHCHIARHPVPLYVRTPAVPRQLSEIVMTLLAKTAEERYQTAAGLEHDLRRALGDLESSGRIERFVLRERDASERLMMPERLIGRDAEVATLLAGFDQVVADGNAQLVMVSGFSGIGKSSVVNELHRALVPSRGSFAAGKFDQYKRGVPYATFAQAFSGLVAQVLGKSEQEIQSSREQLLEHLGTNGQLIVNMVPELALVIGTQPPIGDLSPTDAQARFHAVLRGFISVFATAEHPLVLFLDDLQWTDSATLEALEHVLASDEIRHLLVVGAYRDNEVDAAHPLVQMLERLRARPRRLREIVLTPLKRDHIAALCAEALRTSLDGVESLAALVYEKCGGNPFFTFQFITALVDENLVSFDAGAWRWNIDAIQAKGFTDNVVDLMTMRLHRLPPESQRAARQMACIGSSARVEILELVLGWSREAIAAAFAPAVAAGLVHRAGGGYAFLHDRIHEASYAMLPAAERPAEHLRIARVLAALVVPTDDRVFEVCNHYNLGAALVDTQDERDRMVALNRLAAERARASTANAVAHTYASRARALLSGDCWERMFRLAFDVELLLGDCEFLVGNFEAAEVRLDALRGRAVSLPDLAAVIYTMTVLYTAMPHRIERSVSICLDYLRRVGIDWPIHPPQELVVAEFAALRERIATRSFDELLHLPLAADADKKATLEVLLGLTTPSFSSDPNMLGLVLCRMANLSLAHGHTDESSLGYAFLGMTISCAFRDFSLGYQFGKLARDLVEQRNLVKYRGRVFHTLGTHVLYWTQPFEVAEASLRIGVQAMREIGDITYVCFGHCGYTMLAAASGKPLDQLQAIAEACLELCRPIRFELCEDIQMAEQWLARVLMGEVDGLGELEERAYAGPLTRCWYLIRKLMYAVVMGDFPLAVATAREIGPLAPMQIVFLNIVDYHFYAALARAAVIGAHDEEHLEALALHRVELAALAAASPENLTSRLLLVDAEIARVDGRLLEAMELYERAIQEARARAMPHIAALAFETASRFYDARGLETLATACQTSARAWYKQWGAAAKVNQLVEVDAPRSESRLSLEIETPSTALDLATVVKSSQAVSGETGLDKLVETLMSLAIEHAGADRGLLVLTHRDVLHIEAEATVGDKEIVVEHRRGVARFPALPESVANYVARTRELVLVADAKLANQFSADPYMRDRCPRSVVCIPLVKQSALVGMLYLENTLAPNVFTNARIAVLKLLASQAATSLQNASLEAENASLAEKEALLKEVHHRVKNNLQLISSLLSLQANRITDPAVAELFSESRNRVRSMALVHENLYRAGNLAKISMEVHVRTLVAQLRQAYGLEAQRIALETTVSDVHLEMSRAVSSGLIINELVSNALKHAFPTGRPGRVWVELNATDADATLVVRDDGVGLSSEFDLASCSTLGMQLVADLTAQLHGTVTVTRSPGTAFTIVFPLAS